MTSRLKEGVFYVQEKSSGWDGWTIVDKCENIEEAKDNCRARRLEEEKNRNYQARVAVLGDDNELEAVF